MFPDFLHQYVSLLLWHSFGLSSSRSTIEVVQISTTPACPEKKWNLIAGCWCALDATLFDRFCMLQWEWMDGHYMIIWLIMKNTIPDTNQCTYQLLLGDRTALRINIKISKLLNLLGIGKISEIFWFGKSADILIHSHLQVRQSNVRGGRCHGRT